MYCMYRNKTRESLKVIRETVIKALHSSTLHPYKHCPNFTTNVTRAKAKGEWPLRRLKKDLTSGSEIRESLMRLTLVYINCATGCLMPDLKVNQQQQNLAPNATQTHCSEEHNLNPNTLSFYFPSPRASIDEGLGMKHAALPSLIYLSRCLCKRTTRKWKMSSFVDFGQYLSNRSFRNKRSKSNFTIGII